MWRRAICNPWTVLVLLVIGGPGMADDLQAWVRILGMNVLTTIALMGLAAHVTAVGFQDWEPYRSWFARFRRPRLRYGIANLDGIVTEWSCVRVPRGRVGMLRFDGSGRYAGSLVVEAPSSHRVQFIDSPATWVRDESGTCYRTGLVSLDESVVRPSALDGRATRVIGDPVFAVVVE